MLLASICPVTQVWLSNGNLRSYQPVILESFLLSLRVIFCHSYCHCHCVILIAIDNALQVVQPLPGSQSIQGSDPGQLIDPYFDQFHPPSAWNENTCWTANSLKAAHVGKNVRHNMRQWVLGQIRWVPFRTKVHQWTIQPFLRTQLWLVLTPTCTQLDIRCWSRCYQLLAVHTLITVKCPRLLFIHHLTSQTVGLWCQDISRQHKYIVSLWEEIWGQNFANSVSNNGNKLPTCPTLSNGRMSHLDRWTDQFSQELWLQVNIRRPPPIALFWSNSQFWCRHYHISFLANFTL